MSDVSLPSNSPWQFLAAFGRPDIRWCEKLSEGILAEPGNALTNIFYALVALFLWFYYIRGKEKNQNRDRLKLMAVVCLYTGLASFLYHTTYSFLFQVFDFSAIFLITLPVILWNLQALGQLNEKNTAIQLSIGMLGLFSLFFLLRFMAFPVQLLIGLLMLTFLTTEIVLSFKKIRVQERKFLFIALAFFVAGFYFNFLDLSKKWCQPEHLIHGHGVWHLMSALGIGFLARYTKSWRKS